MKNLMCFRPPLLASLLIMGLPACSRDSKPDGIPDLQPLVLSVTQAGTPLAGATIQLIPNDPSKARWAGGGVTDAMGNASITTLGQYEGVAPGSYKVTFYKMLIEGGSAAPGNDDPSSSQKADVYLLIDPKYQTTNTTPVQIDVLDGINCYRQLTSALLSRSHRGRCKSGN